MNQPYKYQTFKQLPNGGKGTVYLQVIHIKIQDAQRIGYTLLNLDGTLNTSEITSADFSLLIEKKVIEEWKP